MTRSALYNDPNVSHLVDMIADPTSRQQLSLHRPSSTPSGYVGFSAGWLTRSRRYCSSSASPGCVPHLTAARPSSLDATFPSMNLGSSSPTWRRNTFSLTCSFAAYFTNFMYWLTSVGDVIAFAAAHGPTSSAAPIPSPVAPSPPCPTAYPRPPADDSVTPNASSKLIAFVPCVRE